MNTILLSSNDINEISDYCLACLASEEQMDIFINPLFNEGLIKVDMDGSLTYQIHFKVDSKNSHKFNINVSVLKSKIAETTHIGSAYVIDYGNTTADIVFNKLDLNRKSTKILVDLYGGQWATKGKVFVSHAARVFYVLMEYVYFKTKDRKIIHKTGHSRKSSPSKVLTNSTSNADNILSLKDVVQYARKRARQIERHVDSWTVAGHYRHYRDKDGNIIKTVPVKSYVKGLNRKPIDKSYTLQ